MRAKGARARYRYLGVTDRDRRWNSTFAAGEIHLPTNPFQEKEKWDFQKARDRAKKEEKRNDGGERQAEGASTVP